MTAMTASEVVALLGMEPHIEGGFYRQTFADAPNAAGRPHSTLIYYLLDNHQTGAWHRVDSSEVWHWYAGAPMRLDISRDGKTVTEHALGNDLAAGERPQLVIPGNAWQRAACLGDWTLVGCTVAPGFQFSKFEQAEPGWEPG
ncbi:MAG: cupin [Devosia sp.]|jgi:predicted cupin superfamily sugar epimerase|nr:cupin [Devosia sp.]